MKDERGGSRPERKRGRLPHLRSSGGISEQWLQVVDRVSPVVIRTELGGVGSREEGGETEKRVGGKEAVLASGRRVEQKVDEWVLTAKLGQRAGLTPAKDPDLARLAQDQSLCCRHDVSVTAPGAQQPCGNGRIEWLVDRFEGCGHCGEVTSVALVQTD